MIYWPWAVITVTKEDSETTMAVLSDVKTKDGVFDVGGNHYEYHDLCRTMQKYGFTHLDNQGLHLKQGFYIAGVVIRP